MEKFLFGVREKEANLDFGSEIKDLQQDVFQLVQKDVVTTKTLMFPESSIGKKAETLTLPQYGNVRMYVPENRNGSVSLFFPGDSFGIRAVNSNFDRDTKAKTIGDISGSAQMIVEGDLDNTTSMAKRKKFENICGEGKREGFVQMLEKSLTGDITNIQYVGHSRGGPACMRLLDTNPSARDLISDIVLLDGTYDDHIPRAHRDFFTPYPGEGLKDFVSKKGKSVCFVSSIASVKAKRAHLEDPVSWLKKAGLEDNQKVIKKEYWNCSHIALGKKWFSDQVEETQKKEREIKMKNLKEEMSILGNVIATKSEELYQIDQVDIDKKCTEIQIERELCKKRISQCETLLGEYQQLRSQNNKRLTAIKEEIGRVYQKKIDGDLTIHHDTFIDQQYERIKQGQKRTGLFVGFTKQDQEWQKIIQEEEEDIRDIDEKSEKLQNYIENYKEVDNKSFEEYKRLMKLKKDGEILRKEISGLQQQVTAKRKILTDLGGSDD